jgi:DNA-binding transcriptional regulator YiaG
MTPAEFRAGRQQLGLTLKELGGILNTDPRTVRRWENHERPLNPIADRVMEWLLAGYRPPQWPEEKADGNG